VSTEQSNVWPVLSAVERRVLGVLVEKQKTTDTYPLTLNAVVTGSNQKSNREPFLSLTDQAAEEALTEAQHKGLVMRVVSGRVDKWRHLLYEAWQVNSVDLAILTELLLRGPQSEGELRARASRMDDIADVDALRRQLQPLADRKLVVFLTPQGKRGTMVTHGFHDPHELEQLRCRESQALGAACEMKAISNAPNAAALEVTPPEARWIELSNQIAELCVKVHQMEEELIAIRSVVNQLQPQLRSLP